MSDPSVLVPPLMSILFTFLPYIKPSHPPSVMPEMVRRSGTETLPPPLAHGHATMFRSHRTQSAQIMFFTGLLALAVKAYGFTLVRPCVRPCVTAYLENRTSDFDDFLHKPTF